MAPRGTGFPRCNNAEIERYMRMQTDPPLQDPKVEMLLGQCKEVDATPEETILMTDNWFLH